MPETAFSYFFMCPKIRRITALITYRFPKSDVQSVYIDQTGTLLRPNVANPESTFPLAPVVSNQPKKSGRKKKESAAVPTPVFPLPNDTIAAPPPVPTIASQPQQQSPQPNDSNQFPEIIPDPTFLDFSQDQNQDYENLFDFDSEQFSFEENFIF